MTPAIANLCSSNCYLERTSFSIKYRKYKSILDIIYRSVHQFFFVYIYFQYLLIGLFTTSTIYIRFILLYIKEHSSVLYAILFFGSLLFSKFKGPRQPGSRFLVTPCHTYAQSPPRIVAFLWRRVSSDSLIADLVSVALWKRWRSHDGAWAAPARLPPTKGTKPKYRERTRCLGSMETNEERESRLALSCIQPWHVIMPALLCRLCALLFSGSPRSRSHWLPLPRIPRVSRRTIHPRSDQQKKPKDQFPGIPEFSSKNLLCFRLYFIVDTGRILICEDFFSARR